MRKLFFASVFLIVVFFALVSSTQAQVVVKVEPARPATVIVKPAKGRKGYVWVDGHWRYSKRMNRYVWVDASWIRVKRGHSYVAGHWAAAPGGYKWIPGHWARI